MLANKSPGLLQLFRKNIFLNSLLLIPYAFFLHLGVWLRKVPIESQEANWIFNQSFGRLSISYEWNLVLSVILITMEALLINRIVIQYRLNPNGQLFGGIFFILFCGFHSDTLLLSAPLVGNLFFLFALLQLFSIYQKKHSPIALFNVGFFIGLASLFYVPFYIFLFLGIIGLMVLKGFQFREMFQIIIGFGVLYFLSFSIFYFLNLHELFLNIQIGGFFKPYLFSMVLGSKGWIAFSILLILMLVCLVQFGLFQSRQTILLQKYYDLLFWTSFISMFSIFFLQVKEISHLILWITPLAFLVGLVMSKIKNQLIAETIHLIFVVTALFLQFQNW
ncbi:MAG: hypothetical protein M3Q56_13140 [Bacteroidota bacterium]|nr:hypothetical protein [Bacteroidota bacterium]